MSIAKFNKDYFETGIGFLYYCFIRAWPLSISSTPVNYDSGSILKLNVTFRYERYVMENVTRGMIRSGWKGYSDSFDPWMGRYDDHDPILRSEDDTSVNPTNTKGKGGQGGLPLGTTTIRNDGKLKGDGKPYKPKSSNYRNRQRGSAFN